MVGGRIREGKGWMVNQSVRMAREYGADGAPSDTDRRVIRLAFFSLTLILHSEFRIMVSEDFDSKQKNLPVHSGTDFHWWVRAG
jgi:hypothetical protein